MSERDDDRKRFIEAIWGMIDYWEKVGTEEGKHLGGSPNDPPMTVRRRLSGLMHTLLNEIDHGGDAGPWAVQRIISDDVTGKEIARGEDIGGGLHEILYPDPGGGLGPLDQMLTIREIIALVNTRPRADSDTGFDLIHREDVIRKLPR